MRGTYRKLKFLFAGTLLASLILSLLYFFQRPTRVQIEAYVPADALIFIELRSISHVVEGIARTKAWRELAPKLAPELEEIGDLAALARFGFGPSEIAALGRAQLAIAVTDIEVKTGYDNHEPHLHLRPHFALIAEMRSPSIAAKLVWERAPLLARKLYGDSAIREQKDHRGIQLVVFRGSEDGRNLVVAARGSAVLLANDEASLRSCLDVMAGRSPSLAENIEPMRPIIDRDGALFAFVTAAGLEKLFKLGPELFASRFTADPEKMRDFSSLLGQILKQTVSGLLYSAQFTPDGVTEKYLAVLNPELAAPIAKLAKPATGWELLGLMPKAARDFTILRIKSVGNFDQRLLEQLSPRITTVAALALRQLMAGLRRGVGLDAEVIGDEIAILRFDHSDAMAFIIQIRRQADLPNQLARQGMIVRLRARGGAELLASTGEDRAAAFLEGYLVLGRRDQVERIIEAHSSQDVLLRDDHLRRALELCPSSAPIISFHQDADAVQMILAISRLAGGHKPDQSQAEVQVELPPSVSFTQFRDYGIYTESRSAVGSFGLLGALAARAD